MSAVITDNDSRPASVADTLRRARALIEDPKHWTKHFFARAADGEPRTNPNSSDAVAFCAIGAVERTNGLFEDDAKNLLSKVLPWAYYSVSQFNDQREHADVLALFDRAIAAAESDS